MFNMSREETIIILLTALLVLACILAVLMILERIDRKRERNPWYGMPSRRESVPEDPYAERMKEIETEDEERRSWKPKRGRMFVPENALGDKHGDK